MRTESVSATVALLLTAEFDVADRDEVAAIVRRSREVQSWLDSVNVACARRTRELAASGRAEPPESLLSDEGQRPSKETVVINQRVPACDAMPKFEAALAARTISGGHVDAVATVLARLDEEIRSAFVAEQDRLLGAAQRDGVETFLSGCRDLARFLTAERDRRTGADTEMEELARQRAASKIRQWTNKDTGMMHTHVELDPARGAKLKKALADMLRRHRKIETNAGVPWDQMEVDSFLNGIDRAVATRVAANEGADHRAGADAGAPVTPDACGPRDGPSDDGGTPLSPLTDLRIPEIGVFIDLPTLLDGLHEHSICETYDGIPIPVSQVRRWRFLGTTDISKLVPVCSKHHHLAHEGGWTLSMTPERVVTWTRPDGTIHSVHNSIDRAPGGVGRNRTTAPTGPTATTSPAAPGAPSAPVRDPNRRVA